jgi:hypothetical protein
MKFPKRVPQHISETASFKIFSNGIPDNWIIRDITERDYGIDCYLEIVTEQNEVTGQLALIQLKARQKISWTKDGTYTLNGVDIATTNYWYNFPVPVFIFLVDIEKEESFFIHVKQYIRIHFDEYSKQDKLNYVFENKYRVPGNAPSKLFTFRLYHLQETYRQQFESELLFFLSSLRNFQEFQSLHDNLDFHLGIESTDQIFFESMHKNYEFLCTYLEIKSKIPTLEQIKSDSHEKFKSPYYDLHEHDLTEWMGDFRNLTTLIVQKAKHFIGKEENYWKITNRSFFAYIHSLGKNGELPDF